MSKTPFRTWLNHKEEGAMMEKNTMPSMTEPDGTLSLREMLDRLAKGLPVTLRNDGYDEDDDLTDFEGLDLSDLEDARHYAAERVREAKSAYQAMEDAKLADQARKRKAKEVPPNEEEPEP